MNCKELTEIVFNKNDEKENKNCATRKVLDILEMHLKDDEAIALYGEAVQEYLIALYCEQ